MSDEYDLDAIDEAYTPGRAERDSIRDKALEEAALKLKASCTTCWGTSGDHGCNVCGKPMEIIRALKGTKPCPDTPI